LAKLEELTGYRHEANGKAKAKPNPLRPIRDTYDYVVEGENDVTMNGNISGTCNAGGANTWTAEHAKHLQGANATPSSTCP
jgi:hypothetical protein